MPCQILIKITNYWLSLEAILFHSCWPVFIYQVDWKGFLLQLIFLAIYISDQWLVFYMNPEIHLCVSSLLFFPGNEDFSSFGINCFLLWHCFLICIMCSKVRNNTCVNMFGEAGWLSGWGTVLVIKWSSVQAFYPVFHWICSWLPQVQLLCCTLYIANWTASYQLGILNILFMFVYNVYLQFVWINYFLKTLAT